MTTARPQSTRSFPSEATVKKIDEQTRREFFTSSSQIASAAAVMALLQGCGGGGGGASGPSPSVAALPTIEATIANSTITLTIDASSPLAAVGGAALIVTSNARFLVARTAPDAFVAFTATCTHQACTITGYASPRFVCPCHGSTFDTGGRPVSGPAPRPLQQYATSLSGDVLSIAV